MTRAAAVDERSTTSNSAAVRSAASRNPNFVNAIALKRALAAAEHAAFLWSARDALAHSSAVTFDALAQFDDRLSRLVYKLSERPALGERLLQHDHAALKRGLAFVTTIVALRGGAAAVFDELLTRLEADRELLSPVASALTWLDYAAVRPALKRLLVASSPAHVQLGIVAAVAHGVNPGVALERALDDESSALRASALEAVGRLALSDFHSQTRAALADEDLTCRFWAAWSAVRSGERAGIPVLGRIAAECGRFARAACDMALRALEPDQALRAHDRLMAINTRLGVVAAGIVGDPRLVPWMFESMETAALARVAGAAFCLMSGRDLRRDDLDTEGPLDVATTEGTGAGTPERQPAEVQPSNDLTVESFADESDDDLVWPDVVRLRAWWNAHHHDFIRGTRYLAGVPIGPAALATILRTGNQQQRAAAALERAVLHPDTPLIDVTAPAHRQIGTSNQLLQ